LNLASRTELHKTFPWETLLDFDGLSRRVELPCFSDVGACELHGQI